MGRASVAAVLLMATGVLAQQKTGHGIEAVLGRLAARDSVQVACTIHSPALEARMRAALARRRALGRQIKSFRITAVRVSDVTCWIASEVAAKQAKAPDEFVLARVGGAWLAKAAGREWRLAQRPTGVWHAAWLPDPAFLAGALLRLTKAKWTAGAEAVDDRMLRTYTAKLGMADVTALIEGGAVPDSSSAGIGNVARRYLTSTPRIPERSIEVTVYEDPKARQASRIVIKMFQANMRTATNTFGTPGVPGPSQGPNLYLQTELAIGDVSAPARARVADVKKARATFK